MKKKTFFLLLTGIVLTLSVRTQTLQVVLAADTANPNTEFAESCQSDLHKMTREFRTMADSMGYPFKLYGVTGNNFTSQKLKETVAAVPVEPGDIYFFYFSGAGFCEAEDEENRVLRLGVDGQDLISTSEIIPVITSKEARLNLVIIDACSVIRQVTIGSTKGAARHQVYRSLLSACGTVIVFSSRCSEFSYGNRTGGLFTNAFLAALTYYIQLGSQDLTWDTLLKRAQNITAQTALKKIFRPQHPQYFFKDNFNDKCIP